MEGVEDKPRTKTALIWLSNWLLVYQPSQVSGKSLQLYQLEYVYGSWLPAFEFTQNYFGTASRVREMRPCIALRTAPFLQRHLIQPVCTVWEEEWNKQCVKTGVSHNRVNHHRQNWILALPGTCVLPATLI